MTYDELAIVANGLGIFRWRDGAELRAKVEAWPMADIHNKPTPLGTEAPEEYSTRFVKPDDIRERVEPSLRCPACVWIERDTPTCMTCRGTGRVNLAVFRAWYAKRNGRPTLPPGDGE